MSKEKYPPLPEPDTHCWDDDTSKDVWSYSAELMREIIAADRAARGVPDGWVLVPIEATTEMVLALMGTGLRNTEYKSKAASPSIFEMKQGYSAMLAAAPQPAAQAAEIGKAMK